MCRKCQLRDLPQTRELVNKLYEMKPAFVVTKDAIQLLRTSYVNHVPEIPKNYCQLFKGTIEEFEVRVLVSFRKDYRRYWRLSTVWYQDHPVMVIGNAGREGDDSSVRFVTDVDRYGVLIKAIHQFLEKNEYYARNEYNQNEDFDLQPVDLKKIEEDAVEFDVNHYLHRESFEDNDGPCRRTWRDSGERNVDGSKTTFFTLRKGQEQKTAEEQRDYVPALDEDDFPSWAYFETDEGEGDYRDSGNAGHSWTK